MRIIGGKYKGRVLAQFKGWDVRPTADRVKESLFNILFTRFQGARVLDLFCGTGALGIEALSRGAKEVVFNDLSKDSVALLKKNLTALKAEENYSVYNLGFDAYLTRAQGTFDIVFIDPPYASDNGIVALETIAAKGLLAKDGVIVYERDRRFSGRIDGLKISDERKYGNTFLTFFVAEEEQK